MQRTPVLDGSRIRISILHERSRGYIEDCGLGRLLGIGEHDCVRETRESDWIEEVGAVVVDLRAGRCEFVPSDSPRDYTEAELRATAPTPRAADARVSHGGRTFVATQYQVEELDAGGTTVAIHRLPKALLPEAYASDWLEPVPWPVGETRHGRTLTQTDHGLVLVSPERTAIELGPDAKTVYLLGDSTLAATEGMLIDVAAGWKTWHTATIEGVPRAAAYVTHNWLMEFAGHYWYVEPRFGTMTSVMSGVTPVGRYGTTLVVRSIGSDALLLFDAAARTWREIKYAGCIPADPASER